MDKQDAALTELAFCIGIVTMQGSKRVPADSVHSYLWTLRRKMEEAGLPEEEIRNAAASAERRQWARARIDLCAAARDAVRAIEASDG